MDTQGLGSIPFRQAACELRRRHYHIGWNLWEIA